MARARRSRRLLDCLSAITIEPMLFVKTMATDASYATFQNMRLDRFCQVTLGYSAEVCDSLSDGHHQDAEVEVQKLANVFNFYSRLISSIIPVLMISFIAAWSDRRGRRMPILLGLFGLALSAGTYFLVSFFPSWPPEVLYVAAFCNSLGGIPLFYMAAYGYVADKSEICSRTKRLAIVRGIWLLGTPAGTTTGTLIFSAGGYTWVTGVCTILYVLCFVYSAIIIKDNEKPRDGGGGTAKQRPLYSPMNVVDLFCTCFRKRQGRGRLHISTLMCMMLFCNSTVVQNIIYLWGLRVLNWDIYSYSIFSITNDVSQAVMILLLTPAFLYFRLHDCSLGGITAVLVFTRLLALGMTTKPSQWWVPYLFILIPDEYLSIAIRSLMSKICEKDEIGRVFAMLAVLEVFWPIVDSAIFTSVYGATIEFYPSFEHLVGAGFAFLGIAGFLGLRLSLNNDQIRALKKKKKMMIIDAEKAAVVKSHPVLVRT
ncbi:lysosomal proton-coupled steroid conjugate and bile acid symporter SLC46A3-like isoform X2 [Macrobrachium nipponense]|uniref:lysosomal proton-coupled steroid conjugate and bile acid symporter SLC46A3-like isoform X2 n=1 Tax=Macrobrachium nipponense TaxID=159736 RepID=UPI0030C84034